MSISRRNLFRMFGALPFIKLEIPKSKIGKLIPPNQPLLLEASIKHQSESEAEVFYVRHMSGQVRKLEEWVRNSPYLFKRYKRGNIT